VNAKLRNRINKNEEAGFTLIELLIVIVILGILAAIVVFAVGTATTDSKASACKADKKTVQVAAEAYKAKKGGYPTQAQMTTGADATLKSFPTATVANEGYAIAYDGAGGVTASGACT
jgi:prepilin-type N-terminal cleavage/methylation domain-containing protein